jgi:hypothetical protein
LIAKLEDVQKCVGLLPHLQVRISTLERLILSLNIAVTEALANPPANHGVPAYTGDVRVEEKHRLRFQPSLPHVQPQQQHHRRRQQQEHQQQAIPTSTPYEVADAICEIMRAESPTVASTRTKAVDENVAEPLAGVVEGEEPVPASQMLARIQQTKATSRGVSLPAVAAVPSHEALVIQRPSRQPAALAKAAVELKQKQAAARVERGRSTRMRPADCWAWFVREAFGVRAGDPRMGLERSEAVHPGSPFNFGAGTGYERRGRDSLG